jgi:ribose 5-phosphate isomerase RpiB
LQPSTRTRRLSRHRARRAAPSFRKSERGVVIDAMGIGSTMAANKVPGVRCALVTTGHDEERARAQRRQRWRSAARW